MFNKLVKRVKVYSHSYTGSLKPFQGSSSSSLFYKYWESDYQAPERTLRLQPYGRGIVIATVGMKPCSDSCLLWILNREGGK